VGRDPAQIEISAGTEDPDARPEELGVALREQGVSLFTVNASGPDYDLAPLRRWITWRDAQNS
jgi:hypothetical protein